MKTCPNCNSEVVVLIHNLSSNKRFCHHCAGTGCPTLTPGLVYTLDDVKFLRKCGIDPQIENIESMFLNEDARKIE